MSSPDNSQQNRDNDPEVLEASQATGNLRKRLSQHRTVCALQLTDAINLVTDEIRGRSRRFTIFAAILLVVCLVIAPVAAASVNGLVPLKNIPSSTPGVNASYNDTYRVYANNDQDISPENITHTGYFESDYPFGPVELGVSSKSPSQVLRYASTADVYVTKLSGYDSVPIADNWAPYSSMSVHSDTHFIENHSMNTYDGPSSNGGEMFVLVTNTQGEFRAVYNADVEWNENADKFNVTNPGEALVNKAKYGTDIGRSKHIAQQYSQYAQDSDRVAVPTVGGNELYPTSSGASMPRKWGQGDYATVDDAWVGINNIIGGVMYRGRYVSGGTPTRGAHVPFDHRASAPSDFSKDGKCAKDHEHSRTKVVGYKDKTVQVGNTTKVVKEPIKKDVTYDHTHHYPKKKWAKYDLINSTANVTSVRLDRPGFNGTSDWKQFGQTRWTALKSASYAMIDYPRGDYTLTATLEVTTKIETRWGVNSARCNEWKKSSVDEYTHTTQYKVPVSITDYNSPNQQIDVTHIDGAGKDRLIVNWDGNQDLPNDPWRKISVDIGKKTFEIDSPWRFYGVSRNDEVEIRTGKNVDSEKVTHTHGDRWPAIFHYETSVANVSNGFPQRDDTNQKWGYAKTLDGKIWKTLSGSPLSAGVDDPENGNQTNLYTQQVIEIRSSDLKTNETASVSADNPWGSYINSSISSQPYEPTRIEFRDVNTSDTGKGHTATLVLTDTAGNPIQNAVVNVSNGNGMSSTLTTNNNGRADITWDGMLVRADYEGSLWLDPGKPYYKESTALNVVEPSFEFQAVSDIGEYISTSISNTLVFAEWLLLGIFALWWVRMRRRSSKGGSG